MVYTMDKIAKEKNPTVRRFLLMHKGENITPRDIEIVKEVSSYYDELTFKIMCNAFVDTKKVENSSRF